jgi:hypothetical protein
VESQACPAETVESVLDGGGGALEVAGYGGEGLAFGDGAEDLGEVQLALGIVVQGEGGGRESCMAGRATETRDRAVAGGMERSEPTEEEPDRV